MLYKNKRTSLFGLFVGDRENCLIILTLEVIFLKFHRLKLYTLILHLRVRPGAYLMVELIKCSTLWCGKALPANIRLVSKCLHKRKRSSLFGDEEKSLIFLRPVRRSLG